MYRRELYAVHQAMRHFLTDFEGRHLTVFIDHLPLVGTFQSPSPQPHNHLAANQIMEIANWTTDIRHVAGKSNPVADWLSRPPEKPMGAAYRLEPEDHLEPEVASFVLASFKIEKHQVATFAETALKIIDPKELAAAQAKSPDVTHHKANKKPHTAIMKDVQFTPGTTVYCEISKNKARPLVPESWRETIIRCYNVLDHHGFKPTIKKVADNY